MTGRNIVTAEFGEGFRGPTTETRAWRARSDVEEREAGHDGVLPVDELPLKAGDVAEVLRSGANPGAPSPMMQGAELLSAVLGAGDEATVTDAVHVVLGACIDHWAACMAVGWVWTSDEGSAVVARRATGGGHGEAPDLAARLEGMSPEEIGRVLAQSLAPRVVHAIALQRDDEEQGRLWLVFARDGALPERCAAVTWIGCAAMMAVRAVHARRHVRQLEARIQHLEDAAREGDARLAAVMEVVPDPLLLTDTATGQIVRTNAAAQHRYAELFTSKTAATARTPASTDDPGVSWGVPAGEAASSGVAGGVASGVAGDALAGHLLQEVIQLEQAHAPRGRSGNGEERSPLRIHRRQAPVHGRQGHVVRVEDRRPLQQLEATAMQLHRDATLGRLAADAAQEVLMAQAGVATALAAMQFELVGARFGVGSGDGLDACVGLVQDAQEASARIRRASAGLARLGRAEHDSPRRVDLAELVDMVLAMVEPQLARRAAVVRALAPVPAVTVNPGQLGQVLLHLLSNASHAIPEGRPGENTIQVETRAEPGAVVLAVRDTGCGISADRLGSIFEPFQTSRARGQGVGLGLTVCRELVAQWGGRLEVESEVNRGSRFRVVLPPV